MRMILASAAAAALTACASGPPEKTDAIDYSRPPPADWPELELDVHTVTRADFAAHCPTLRAHSLGCALLDFCSRRCTVLLVHMPEHQRSTVLDHEQAHCLGYDHPGSSQGREAWARAKAAGCGR